MAGFDVPSMTDVSAEAGPRPTAVPVPPLENWGVVTVLAELDKSIDSPEHRRFVAQLAAMNSP